MGFLKDNFLTGIEQMKEFSKSLMLYLEELKKKSNEAIILVLKIKQIIENNTDEKEIVLRYPNKEVKVF